MTDIEKAVEEYLGKFWILDGSEYSIIKELIDNEIQRLDKEIKNARPIKEDDVRMYNEDINLRDFYIVLKEKVSHIITNGLCKK